MKKTLTAIAAAALVATATVAIPQQAEARWHGRNGAIIGGIAAGALLGAAAAGSYGYYGGPAYYYGGPAYYGPSCYWTHSRYWNGYRWHWRRVRVCN
jgi:hypothetical protein